MNIPVGMEDGCNHPIAQKVQSTYPDSYIGATLFRGDLSIHIQKEALIPICTFLKNDLELDFDFPIHITSVDDPPSGGRPLMAPAGRREKSGAIATNQGRFEMVYELFSIRKKHQVRIKARVSEADCTIDSVTGIWMGANYLEREVFDMMGIRFNNHPELKRILLPDEYTEGYPLRKDFPVEGRGWRDTFEFLDAEAPPVPAPPANRP
jgi:NADH-quinone oxidoreductase subunit C